MVPGVGYEMTFRLTRINTRPAAHDYQPAHEAAEDRAAHARRAHARREHHDELFPPRSRIPLEPFLFAHSQTWVHPSACCSRTPSYSTDRFCAIARHARRGCIPQPMHSHQAQDEADHRSEAADQQRLQSQQRHIRQEEMPPRLPVIQLADVRRGAQTRGKTHFEVALEIADHRHEDEELVDPPKHAPSCEMFQQLACEDQTNEGEK